MAISPWELVARLVLAGILGGLIGVERESHQRPAGFRTHILVCMGSALVMLVSVYAFAAVDGPGVRSYDPGRLAAQVVSGIGFLGAGTILREGAAIRGLTTAASLWVVAGIGLAVGSGFYLGATLTTLLAAATLVFLSKIERRFFTSKRTVISVTIADQPGRLGVIASVLGKHGVNIRSVEITPDSEEIATLELSVDVPARVERSQLLTDLASLPGVIRVNSLR